MGASEYLVPPSKIVEYTTAGADIPLTDGSEVVEISVQSVTATDELSLKLLDGTTSVLTVFTGWTRRILRVQQINAASSSGITVQVSYL
jgi:hypothetical protein